MSVILCIPDTSTIIVVPGSHYHWMPALKGAWSALETDVKFLMLCLVILSLLGTSIPVSGSLAPPQNASNQTYRKLVEESISSQVSRMDTRAAMLLAISSNQFSTDVAGFSYDFSEIFNTWQLTAQGAAIWNTVNVVFGRYNGTVFDGWIVVRLDPALSRVISTELQVGNPSASDIKQQTWSGYRLYSNSGQNGAVYEAQSSWLEPSVSEPSAGACPIWGPCYVMIWAGLTQDPAYDLVQGGTVLEAWNVLGVPLSSHYMWTEVLRNQSTIVECTDYSPSAGDSISVDIISHAKSGGDVDSFDLYVTDTTSSHSCSVTSYHNSAVGTPYSSNFMVERASNYRLAKFTDVNLAGSMYYNGSLNGITYPYNDGYYDTYSMWNPDNNGYHNVGFSTVFSNSSFSEYFNTASGT